MSPSKLIHQLRLDLTIVVRNGFPWVFLIVLVAMIATYHLVPDDFEFGPQKFLFDESDNGELKQAMIERGTDPDEFVDSLGELEQAIEESSGSLGIILRGSRADPAFEIIHRGEMSSQNVSVVTASLDALASDIRGDQASVSFVFETQREPTEPISMNARAVPMLLIFEVILLGYLFIAVMLFQEKQDGVIRAYRVSPGGTLTWILSKLTLFVGISWIYGAVYVATTLGPGVDWLRLSVLVILGATLMTLVGMTVAVFFDNISEWFVAGVAILVVNMIPLISWGVPSWTPTWVTVLPSFSLLFTTSEVLFPTGNVHELFPQTAIIVLVETLFAALLCWFAVQRKLMKEGR